MGVLVGLEPHQPDSIVGTPGGTALAEASSEFPASALLNDRAFEEWRSAGLTAAQTRFLARYGTTRPRARALLLRGCNLSSRAGVRVLAAPTGGRARRTAITFDGATINDYVVTSNVLAAPESFTLWTVIRAEAFAAGIPFGVPVYFANAIDIPVAASRLFILQIGSDGSLAVRVMRYSATPTILAGPQANNGRERLVAVRVDNGTGMLSLAVDGVSYGSTALLSAHSAQSNQYLVAGRYTRGAVGMVHMISRAATDAEMLSVPPPPVGGEPDVILSWQFAEGTGTSVADSGPNGYNGTIAGTGTWGTMRNPVPAYDSGLIDWRGPWSRRRRILFRGTDDAQTAATLSRTQSMGVTLHVRVTPDTLALGATQTIARFGPAAGTQEFILQVTSAGILELVPHRGGSGTAVASGVSIADGEWHEIGLSLDGHNATASLIVDGVTTSGACPAYSAAGSQRFMLGATSAGRVELSGDVVVFSRRIYAADLSARRYGLWHAGDDPTVRHLYRLDEATGNFTDIAGGATLAVTGSPVRSIRSFDDPTGYTADTEDRRSTPPHELPTDLALDLGSDMEIGEVSVELFDPANTDGYASVGAIDLIECMEPEAGARPGTEEGVELGGISWSQSGIPSIDPDAARHQLDIDLSLLTESERSKVRQALERSRRRVVITRQTLDPTSPFRTDQAVYGVVERPGSTKDRAGTRFAFERRLGITEIPSPRNAPVETLW